MRAPRTTTLGARLISPAADPTNNDLGPGLFPHLFVTGKWHAVGCPMLNSNRCATAMAPRQSRSGPRDGCGRGAAVLLHAMAARYRRLWHVQLFHASSMQFELSCANTPHRRSRRVMTPALVVCVPGCVLGHASCRPHPR
jgi:hypothetical protein